MSDSKLNYVYKLVPSSMAVPNVLPDRLPVSDLDAKSGFIHLSTASQIPNTLEFFFADDSKVFVLRLKYDVIEKDVRWEDPKAEVCGSRAGEGMFPHLYNGLKLGKDEIDSVTEWEKAAGGWDDALKRADSWLIY